MLPLDLENHQDGQTHIFFITTLHSDHHLRILLQKIVEWENRNQWDYGLKVFP